MLFVLPYQKVSSKFFFFSFSLRAGDFPLSFTPTNAAYYSLIVTQAHSVWTYISIPVLLTTGRSCCSVLQCCGGVRLAVAVQHSISLILLFFGEILMQESPLFLFFALSDQHQDQSSCSEAPAPEHKMFLFISLVSLLRQASGSCLGQWLCSYPEGLD